MTEETAPQAGNWYETEEGDVLLVVAVDEGDGTVEVQYADGTVDELDLEAWDSLNAMEVESPEDWHGSMDEATEEEE